MSDVLPVAAPVLEGEVIEVPVRKDKHWLFKPGDPRINRTGRKNGAKQRISTAFIEGLSKWYAKDGYKAIEKVGREKPEVLLQIIATVVPKEGKVEFEHTGSVAVGVVDLQEIKQRTREVLARLGDPDDSRFRAE